MVVLKFGVRGYFALINLTFKRNSSGGGSGGVVVGCGDGNDGGADGADARMLCPHQPHVQT